MKKLFAAVMAVLVTACVGTSPQAKFYNLRSMAEVGAEGQSRKISVGVAAVTVPDYLDRPQMVSREANGVELKVSELNRWGEPLSGMTQRILADDLALLLPGAWVKPQLHSREKFTYIVEVEINRFDGVAGGEAVLDCWWRVSDSAGRIIRRQRESFRLPMGQSYENMAETQSRLISQLAAQIAKAVR